MSGSGEAFDTETDGAVYAKSNDLVMRKVGDEAILVPVRNNVGDLDSVYTLNPVAGRVWALLDGLRTTQQIVEQLCQEYEVPRHVAHADVVELMISLQSAHLVHKV